MPIYEYLCRANRTCVEVAHSMARDALRTWGELCELTGIDPGDTPLDAPVEKRLFPPGISAPMGDSTLKEKGFTKLVRRDKGVYENVTATGGEKRYMTPDDPSSMPHLRKKISD
ncbi:zinc ribbon domain-containing protein [Candidatus Sumerlaeota bacterium]|nr:zinc ribbon domain-containing protein [Candidatus Sumerlaeota bacterium]